MERKIKKEKGKGNNNNIMFILLFFFKVSPIPEIAPIPEKGNSDPVSAMCQQLSQGLSLLSSDDFIDKIGKYLK